MAGWRRFAPYPAYEYVGPVSASATGHLKQINACK